VRIELRLNLRHGLFLVLEHVGTQHFW
jgi:hypothetical protein